MDAGALNQDHMPLFLPRLNPLVKLHKGTPQEDGQEGWVLFHPISNKYYKIGWAEFEYLARFHKFETAEDLIANVKAETTLEPDMDDIKALILYLNNNGLLAGGDTLGPMGNQKAEMSLWKKLVHNYLFFFIPVLRPQKMLDRVYPHITFIFSKAFIWGSLGLLVYMILYTLQQFDEFTHTFYQFFSLQGAIVLTVVFALIKIIHEFAHAFTARRYKVDVPHMGVALIVMYPVLYTEASAMWKIPNKRARMHIGLAGIIAELMIAAYALVLWHILPPGIWQSAAFAAASISLIGSLLINLNPFMRFDGYYVLCDALGIENLHARVVQHTRWRLRKLLFNLRDDPPEALSSGLQRFFFIFGIKLLVYRLFLYLGIALLVNHVFFQPLGWILMCVELLWFIFIPLYKEFKIWYEKRVDIFAQRRGKIAGGFALVFIFWMILPTQNKLNLPAVYHAEHYREIYAPAPATIVALAVKEGDFVQKGDFLGRLESPQMELAVQEAELAVQKLHKIKRQNSTSSELNNQHRGDITQEIEDAQKILSTLREKKEGLSFYANFDGQIKDLDTTIHEGRTVNPQVLLFRLIDTNASAITAYADETQISRLRPETSGYFYPNYTAFKGAKAKITHIHSMNTKNLDWPELSSLYGGPIASEFFSAQQKNTIVPRTSLYKIDFKITENIVKNQNVALAGRVITKGKRHSPMYNLWLKASRIILKESGLNK